MSPRFTAVLGYPAPVAGDEPLRTSVADDAGSLVDDLRAAAGTPGTSRELPPGEVIGEHFVIEDAIGRGGMGAVYRARDRRLDRAVALKLNLQGTDLARARREALALARLAHPNVVTIYEIGAHDGAPFVAMELCEGGNARTWLRERARGWREVLAIYLDAGRGLAAAHAAGLVHRDVKPDNILIGADGRARIGDFGLARDAAGLVGAGVAAREISYDTTVSHTTTTGGGSNLGSPRADGAITATGALVGTPRYMAPEQFEGGAVDARADQFAFCVALYEALCGADPFPPLPGARALAIAAGRLTPPPRRRAIPRRVHAAIARGLRAAPAARWPSMDALLAALDRAGRAPRRIAIAVVAAAALAGALAVVVTRGGEAPARAVAAPPPDPCAGLPADLTEVWNPSTRGAFLTRHTAIASTAAWAAEALDQDSAAWTATRHTACRELPGRADWSPAMAPELVRCLETTRQLLANTAVVTRGRPGELIADIEGMYVPTSCGDPAKLASTIGPADPDAARQLDAIRRLAIQTDHAADRGDRKAAVALGQQGVQEATASGNPLGIALAQRALGIVLLRQAGVVEAEPHLRAAYFGARAAGDGIETFEIALMLANAYLNSARLDDAANWIAHARAEAVRVNSVALNRVNLELLEAQLADAREQYELALAALDRADAALAAIDHPRARLMAATVLNSRGVVLGRAGRTTESLAAHEQALRIQEPILGPDNPTLISEVGNLGLTLLDVGRIDDAIAMLARAHAMADASLPADSVERGYALWNHALGLGRRDPGAARRLFDQAVSIIEAGLGRDHPDSVEVRADRAKLPR